MLKKVRQRRSRFAQRSTYRSVRLASSLAAAFAWDKARLGAPGLGGSEVWTFWAPCGAIPIRHTVMTG